jgi:hypothetical protein
MTTEIVERAPDALELQDMPTAELRRALDEALGITETAIRRVAVIWRELVRRGEDLTGVRFTLAPYMLPVAEGRLLPALVVELAGQARSLARLAELPVADQERLVAGAPIEVYRGEGKVEARPLRDMTFSEVALAVRDGRLLSAAEQRLTHQLAQVTRQRKARPVAVTIRLSPELHEHLASQAETLGRSVTEEAADLVRRGLLGSKARRRGPSSTPRPASQVSTAELVAQRMDQHVSAAEIATEAGVSRARVYQIAKSLGRSFRA